jgi:uncharacterized protein YjgD (DUF1641 family)
MVTENRKYKLIEEIMKISDDALLSGLEQHFKQYIENFQSISHLVKPTRDKLDIDELIKEQNYQGADKTVIDDLIKDMAIEEPIEELLKMVE